MTTLPAIVTNYCVTSVTFVTSVTHPQRYGIWTPHHRPTSYRSPVRSHIRDPLRSAQRRVRVPRDQTYQNPKWQWNGASDSSPSSSDIHKWTLATCFRLLNALHKSGQTLSQTTAPILTRITALGALVFRRFTDVIGRALRVEADYADLTVEYGIAEPCPEDKIYVDPLTDWELSNESSYIDSYGNPVYLQLHGAPAVIFATDFRGTPDDPHDGECASESECPSPRPCQQQRHSERNDRN